VRTRRGNGFGKGEDITPHVHYYKNHATKEGVTISFLQKELDSPRRGTILAWNT